MQIPLFPLHTVLAPGIALPLHVFEERYRAMVKRCLDASLPFGVVLIREGSEVAPRDGTTQELAIAGVGTFAEIREASRYADGRWDVLAVGMSRFLVRQVHPDMEPYLVADVDPYPDEPGDGREDELEALAGRVTRRFVDYLRLLQPRDGESAEPIDVQMEVETAIEEDEEPDEGLRGADTREATTRETDARPVPADDGDAARVALRIPDDPSALSYLFTGIVQVEPDRKQALLEAASAEERLRDLDALLDRELMLLGARLAPFAVDRTGLAGAGN
ncbi:MAG TPA: LON peptidase substrate-binding domain-containing protein [Candidatus Limnocylindrales bacterium]|nr:LON peptidase substrate-binding domain-containing protein [Candidatus Limnocylindrales bacterium]